MKTICEPLFTLPVGPASARTDAEHNIDLEKHSPLMEQADGAFDNLEDRVPVPLYIIAAAALLG